MSAIQTLQILGKTSNTSGTFFTDVKDGIGQVFSMFQPND